MKLTDTYHEHVSQRKPGKWNDCTMVAGLMLWRLTRRRTTAPTLAEAQEIRKLSGRLMTGGTNNGDVLKGIAARYKSGCGVLVRGYTKVMATMKEGAGASLPGTMGNFPAGHRLRRWDPGFTGTHDVLIIQLDAKQDRFWWDDPLAPDTGTYKGEWVTKAEVKQFMGNLAADTLVAYTLSSNLRPVAPPPPPPVVQPADQLVYTQAQQDKAIADAYAAGSTAGATKERGRIVALIS